MKEPDYEQAIDYALRQMRDELSPSLTYHSYWHIYADVIPATERMCQDYGIALPDRQLLIVAAAFHDIGFVYTHIEHERIGVDIIEQVLPGYGFSSRQIDRIASMIMATRLPQSPKNFLEEILVDADLDVLGREDFFARSEHLRQELAALGKPSTERKWAETQLNFLRRHTYFTDLAHELRQPGKDRHILKLEEFLANGKVRS